MEELQAARPHHHETLVTQFHDEFVTPSELRDRVEGCLRERPSKTKGKIPKEGEGTVTSDFSDLLDSLGGQNCDYSLGEIA